MAYEDELTFANDANFGASIVTSNPRITFDANDYFEYNRASNQFKFGINSVVEMLLVAAGITYANGFYSLECISPKMHLESAVSPMEIIQPSAYGDDAYTFNKPYADLPVVTHGIFHTSTAKADYVDMDVFINRNTLSKIGVTLKKINSSEKTHVMISHMMALGVHQ